MDMRIIILIMTMTSSLGIKVSTSRGVYFKNLEGMKVYEHTTPVIYYFDIPQPENINEIRKIIKGVESCHKTQLECWGVKSDTDDLLQWIKELQDLRNDILKEFQPLHKNRVKRGIQWIGSFQHWCCNVLTEEQGQEFRDKESTLREGYTKLREGLIEDHAALLNITTETQVFNNKIVKNVNELRDAMSRIYNHYNNEAEAYEKRYGAFKAAQKYLDSALVQTQKLQYLFSSCKNHFLPLSIVTKEMLLKDLNKIAKLSNTSNFELALDLERDFKIYHHSKLINCYANENTVEIEIKIPLITKGSKFEILEYHPLKFKSHLDQICQWDQDNMLLAYNKKDKNVITILGNDLENCNKRNSLCFITKNRVGNAQSECAKMLFLEKGHDDIMKACIFKCNINHGNPIIEQIDHETFALTNVKTPLIMFDIMTKTKNEIQIEENWPGTLILEIPCSKEVSHKKDNDTTEVLVSTGLPCRKTSFEVKIEHHLPLIWTNYKYMETDAGVHQSIRFPNISNLYDPDWTIKIPHFIPITSNKAFEEKLGNMENFERKWYESGYVKIIENPVSSLLSLWIIILTVVVILLWIKLSISESYIMQAAFK